MMIFLVVPIILLLSSCDPPSDMISSNNPFQNSEEVAETLKNRQRQKCDPYYALSKTCKETDGNVIINGECFQGKLTLDLDGTLSLGGVGTDQKVFSAQLFQKVEDAKVVKPYCVNESFVQLPDYFDNDIKAFSFKTISRCGELPLSKRHRLLGYHYSDVPVSTGFIYDNMGLIHYDSKLMEKERYQRKKELEMDLGNEPEPIPIPPKGDLVVEIFGIQIDPSSISEESSPSICYEIRMKLMKEFPIIKYISSGGLLMRDEEGKIVKDGVSEFGSSTMCGFGVIVFDKESLKDKSIKEEEIPKISRFHMDWRSIDDRLYLERLQVGGQ